ncbi:RecX family transcriptional regulator [Sphingomonas sp.]|uniref:regulatory protein RecX n=1 Tax=Sphingomonas sp. TaxID=28214 RepID=UPI0025F18D06|nr:RecX family transcriptional regulator [Sphingomonas sp.]MBV9529129.1 RecX family transcriptional regulator [Sphingomonas sp.]
MPPRKPRRELPPLDGQGLNSLALRYVERFATTRAKLAAYLDRKLRERGWSGGGAADTRALADRFAERGYVDDSGYALTKARSLSARGYGKRRLADALRVAGVDEPDSAAARDHANEESIEAAIRFARRRRIGPFATGEDVPPQARDKAIGAMVRAGHDFALARAIAAMEPDADADCDVLAEALREIR